MEDLEMDLLLAKLITARHRNSLEEVAEWYGCSAADASSIRERYVGDAASLRVLKYRWRSGGLLPPEPGPPPDASERLNTMGSDAFRAAEAKALAVSQRALEFDPGNVRALVRAAGAASALGSHAEARRFCIRALVLAPDDSAMRRLKAVLDQASGDAEESA
jgi:hypothetical protein